MRSQTLVLVVAMLGVPFSTTARPPEAEPDFGVVRDVPELNGRNAGWIVLADSVLLVDAGTPRAAASAIDRIRDATELPMRFSVETVPGAAGGPDLGVPIGATPILPEGVPAPPGTVESALRFRGSLTLDDGAVEVIRVAPGVAVVHLPRRGVLFTGGLCLNGAHDEMPLDRVEDWIDVLETLGRLGAARIVPGRGPEGGPELLDRQRRWLSQLRDHLREGLEAGDSFEEIRARLVLPWFEEWTGRKASDQRATARRLFEELAGLIPPRELRDLGLREGPSPSRDDPEWTSPRKVVVPGTWRPDWIPRLSLVAPGVEIAAAGSPQEAESIVTDADAMIGWITPGILAAGKRLRWVQAPSAGVERFLAMPGLRESEIVLTNAQRLYGPEIAEHVLGLVLALTRGLRAAVPLQLEGRWDRSALADRVTFLELRGKTMLVVGLGGIGTEVARLADGIGMKVVATRSSRREGPPFVRYVGLSDETLALARDADVVVNCAPLTPATEDMFDASFFDAMKPEAYFVNIGRGRSVDTSALLEALKRGRIAGAGLDVADPEPLPSEHELWRLPSVIVTPHVAARSDRARERLWMLFRENLRRFAAGEPLLSVVGKSRGY